MNAKIVNFRIENVRRVNFFIPECVEHALVSYGTSISVDMKKAYALSWRFDIEYNKNNKKIGDCIICSNNLFEIYSKYNGVNISIVDVIDSENIIRVVESNIEKNIPTIIHLDTYYSNWGPLYLKEHTNHVAMAIGLDQYNKSMYIVDPDYSDEKLCVDYSVIDKATKFYFEIVIGDAGKIKDEDMIRLVCSREEYYLSMISNIKKFADLFRNYFNPKEEFERDDDIECVLDSNLIKRIREVIKDRNMFIIFLEQFNSNYIHQIIEYMYISIGKWNTIMNLIFKSSRTKWKNDFNDIIYKIIMEIADIEMNIFRLFIKNCNDKETKMDLNISMTDERKLFCNLDISRYCNNKGFSYEEGTNADLTNAGEYFQLNKKIDKIICNEISFETYFENKLDNIVCLGQEIYIALDSNIYSIDFILCAEWGTCEDGVTIKYVDGSTERHKVVANDISDVFSDGTIELGCSRTWDGNVINYRAGVTYNRIINKTEKQIRSILLPEAPNMHIISITLILQ